MKKVVLVGCGFMGRMHAQVVKGLAGVELVGVVDKGGDRSAAFVADFPAPVFPTIPEAVAACGPDVVDICTPTWTHADLTVQAAEAGCHVVCEKPMAMNLEEADRMIAACRGAGRELFIAHCIRFWPEYALLKEIIADGRLGRLLSLNLTRYAGFPKWTSDRWSRHESMSGGGVLDMHIHDTDFALYVLGDPESLDSWGTVDDRGASHVFTTLTYDGGQTIAHLEGG
ncbi:MAG: Gfo/Idh/MocA family oxidoreductase, partial [Fimbriimonadaceae bacterium]|nr:Gfo/Idh/MocA family oxidoreductase [Fimbriimonadaceae bacterium]